MSQDTAPQTRFVHCPTCGQIFNGGWKAVYCYCTKVVPTDYASVGHLIGGSEIVRVTEHGRLIAVNIYA